MSARRKKLLTRGHVIAWAVSLALGIGWVVALGALPSGFDPVVALLLGIVGLFGSLIGVLMATGTLVRVLSLFGTRSRSLSSAPGELHADLVFGVCVVLFCLPSLFAYYGW